MNECGRLVALSGSLLMVLAFGCSGEEDNSSGWPGDAGAPTVTGGSGGSGGSSGTGLSPGVGGGTGGSGAPTTIPGTDWELDPTTPMTSQPTLPSITSPESPASSWGSLSDGPKPTNEWWIGLMLNGGQDQIVPLPYYVRARDGQLEFGFPNQDVGDRNSGTNVGSWLSLGASGAGGWTITEYDDISVTLTWSGGGGSMTAPIVQGMPYVTMMYEGLTPDLGGIDVSGTGTRFEATADGKSWVVYTSEEVTFNAGTAAAPLDGWVRVAMAPDAGAMAALDAHSSAVPVRGRADFATAGDTGIIQLTFDTEGAGAPLMMALPHHVPRLADAPSMLQPVVMRTLKGESQGASGSTWRIEYPLGGVSFSAPRPMDPAIESEVRAALQDDAGENPDADGDVYFSGKELGKLARLALIADELGETSIRDTFVSRLEEKVGRWLDGTNGGDSLAHDTTWGGIVSECVTWDRGCEFGQGLYNDHHFHYGYFVYAAAAIAQLDPAWVTEYGDRVEWLIRDYANPYRGDPHFPRLRSFDPYNGHSWAMGLFGSGAGRNQESTSEAVNSYYGVQLWGEATGNEDLAKFGKILRIAESVGAQTYWQIRDPSDIYGAPFSNNPCVGVLWQTFVDFATFFSGDPRHICGIQMIPVTPASEDMLNPDWVAEVWDSKLQPIAGDAGDGWRDFFSSALANWDKDRGCAWIREQNDHDGGNSKTNMLHYCATRP